MSEDLVRELLEEYGDNYAAMAADVLGRGDRDLSISFIVLGVQKYAKDIRQKYRREIKLDRSFEKFIEYEPTPKATKKGPAIPLSDARIEEGMKLAKVFVQWKIGTTSIRDIDKAGLLSEAEKERKSGQGHLDNARIYEMLAAPMSNTETVGEHYRDKINEIEHLYAKATKGKKRGKGGADEAYA